MENITDDNITEKIKKIVESEKNIVETPNWTKVTDSQKFQCNCPLRIDNTITMELNLKLACSQYPPMNRPFYNFQAMLFCSHNNKVWHLGRIEFDPPGSIGPHHRNPPSLKNIPPEITGAHYHSFADNMHYKGLSALKGDKNLPVALPLEDGINNYHDILSIISRIYAIPGLWLEAPSWEPMLKLS